MEYVLIHQKTLEKHLAELEDAKARDHRKLGKDLGIFMFSDLVGKGLPMWLTKWLYCSSYV